MDARPATTAARNPATHGASASAARAASARARLPAVVGNPARSMLSLTATRTPTPPPSRTIQVDTPQGAHAGPGGEVSPSGDGAERRRYERGCARDLGAVSQPEPAAGGTLLDLYDRALTAETFLAAVDAVRRGTLPDAGVPWLIGVARHKLLDHWRRRARDDRDLEAVATLAGDVAEDPWNERLDAVAARATLARLPPPYRAALTLRYLDDLPVTEVAGALGRSVHATEGLLVRARAAFRRAHPREVDRG